MKKEIKKLYESFQKGIITKIELKEELIMIIKLNSPETINNFIWLLLNP